MPALVTHEMLRTTEATAYIMSLEPVLDVSFKYDCLQPNSFLAISFKPNHKIVGSKIIELPYGITNEVETISSLIDIGNIIFKNSRGISHDEAVAMHSYCKKKYKKIQKIK
jgi:hypothetical protein